MFALARVLRETSDPFGVMDVVFDGDELELRELLDPLFEPDLELELRELDLDDVELMRGSGADAVTTS